jgi:acetate kinase
MRVLVLNSGSSSIKFRLVDATEDPTGALTIHAARLHGAVRGIGTVAEFELAVGSSAPSTTSTAIHDHGQALQVLFDRLSGPLRDVDVVGHRVVHGGARFLETTLITAEVEAEIETLSELAPLHNPSCLAGIRGARAAVGDGLPMVAVFDTAFHQTMPEVAKRYALPAELAEQHQIRRYGFHGIAHASLAAGYAEAAGRPLEQTRLITMQLGHGCSVTAIANGRSVETSMGFTPLEGLVMGTRSGDVDPAVVCYLVRRAGVEPAEVERWLNERSGLLGVSGRSSDMRDLLRAAAEEGDARAQFAISLFCHRVRKYVGAYLAVLGGADGVVFGGGIGENAPEIRARICSGMEWFGLRLDPLRNTEVSGLTHGQAARISAPGAGLAVYVVAADEETWIARETLQCLRRLRS